MKWRYTPLRPNTIQEMPSMLEPKENQGNDFIHDSRGGRDARVENSLIPSFPKTPHNPIANIC